MTKIKGRQSLFECLDASSACRVGMMSIESLGALTNIHEWQVVLLRQLSVQHML